MNKRALLTICLVLFFSISVFAASSDASYPELPYKERIFPRGLIPSSHAPSIAESPDGELLVVWHASWNPKAVIWSSRKPAGADKWTMPSIINRTIGRGNKNPVLYLGKNKKLFLFWADEKKFIFKIIMDRLQVKTSEDFGHTWSKTRDVGITWFLPRTHPVTLDNGDIVLPIYTDLSTSSASAVSKDGGMTWQGPNYMLFFFGIQPTIIQRSDSSLFALMRTGMWPRLAWQAESANGGRSWKNQKLSNVENPGYSLEMIKLKSGNIVLAFNDSKKKRSSLSLALSYDGGRTWPCVRTIEDEPGNVFGYPSVVQARNGLIHVVYSADGRNNIVHFVADEKWLEAGRR
ncbi:MAG: exo-alpha-sialidase [Candidatus Omnitrophica bacterium]|jgi:alpha-L-rhamnosidase|nr:exo-alpha-sialidase [Candidatus Omnitrophota bacterium]